MKKLQEQVIQWAKDKGLLTDVTPERIQKQSLKVLEEIGETVGAYLKGNRPELIDGIGDIAVTLIILAEMNEYRINIDYDTEHEFSNLLDVNTSLSDYYEFDDVFQLTDAMGRLKSFAKNNSLELKLCLQSAYDVISKRTGKMVGDTFIKD